MEGKKLADGWKRRTAEEIIRTDRGGDDNEAGPVILDQLAHCGEVVVGC